MKQMMMLVIQRNPGQKRANESNSLILEVAWLPAVMIWKSLAKIYANVFDGICMVANGNETVHAAADESDPGCRIVGKGDKT